MSQSPATSTAAPTPGSAGRSPGSQHEYTITETEEKLTEALREAADSRLTLVTRLEENAKQSQKQTEMIARLISLTQQLSSMREKEAELLEEVDKLKDEVAFLRNNQQQQSSSSPGGLSIENNNNSLSVQQQQEQNTTISSLTQENEELHVEVGRLRTENTALKTQCEFLAEEVKSTISLAASSQRRSAELSRIISHNHQHHHHETVVETNN